MALIVIFPASLLFESVVTPAAIKLKPNSPALNSRLPALILMFPLPVPSTSTMELLLIVTSAIATSVGKLKLPCSLSLMTPSADKPPK